MIGKYVFLKGTATGFFSVMLFAWAASLFAMDDPARSVSRGIDSRGDQGECEISSAETGPGTVIIPSTSHGGPGDLAASHGGGPQRGDLTGPETTSFGSDVHVRASNHDTSEFHQTMVSDSKGNLYVAWQDNALARDYIQLYSSGDGGRTWKAYGYVMNSSADLEMPSLAVGEGTKDVLLLAYIMNDGTNLPVPEVATTTLGSPSFKIRSVPVWSHWESYSRPVINTDAVHWSGWIAYLTCEGIFDSAVKNINVCHWRSLDYGDTWVDEQVVLGGFDSYHWSCPDETYGTTQKRIILAAFNYNDDTLYTMTSDDYAYTWNARVAMYTMAETPLFYVDPEIAAAVNTDNVMLCCTKSVGGDDTVGQGYSKDCGNTWTTLYSMGGYPDRIEFGAALTANEGGDDWHLAFHSEGSVMYTRRPQDLSALWEKPIVVDDLGEAYPFTPWKGVASDWTTNEVCIAWADMRDANNDLDTYVDFIGNRGLSMDRWLIDAATGGVVNFTLDAGPSFAFRNYLLLGSVSGMEPGIPLPGGHATLPLNWDVFTNLVISLVNTPVFKDFFGTLNASGMAKAKLTIGPVAFSGYLRMPFAFATMNPWDYASNAVILMLD